MAKDIQGAVYKIKRCDCQGTYIGEVGRNLKNRPPKCGMRGGLTVSALYFGSSGPDLRLAGSLCCVLWARHFTLTVPLFTWVYKLVPAI